MAILFPAWNWQASRSMVRPTLARLIHFFPATFPSLQTSIGFIFLISFVPRYR